jgi:hypothetical protein
MKKGASFMPRHFEYEDAMSIEMSTNFVKRDLTALAEANSRTSQEVAETSGTGTSPTPGNNQVNEEIADPLTGSDVTPSATGQSQPVPMPEKALSENTDDAPTIAPATTLTTPSTSALTTPKPTDFLSLSNSAQQEVIDIIANSMGTDSGIEQNQDVADFFKLPHSAKAEPHDKKEGGKGAKRHGKKTKKTVQPGAKKTTTRRGHLTHEKEETHQHETSTSHCNAVDVAEPTEGIQDAVNGQNTIPVNHANELESLPDEKVSKKRTRAVLKKPSKEADVEIADNSEEKQQGPRKGRRSKAKLTETEVPDEADKDTVESVVEKLTPSKRTKSTSSRNQGPIESQQPNRNHEVFVEVANLPVYRQFTPAKYAGLPSSDLDSSIFVNEVASSPAPAKKRHSEESQSESERQVRQPPSAKKRKRSATVIEDVSRDEEEQTVAKRGRLGKKKKKGVSKGRQITQPETSESQKGGIETAVMEVKPDDVAECGVESEDTTITEKDDQQPIAEEPSDVYFLPNGRLSRRAKSKVNYSLEFPDIEGLGDSEVRVHRRKSGVRKRETSGDTKKIYTARKEPVDNGITQNWEFKETQFFAPVFTLPQLSTEEREKNREMMQDAGNGFFYQSRPCQSKQLSKYRKCKSCIAKVGGDGCRFTRLRLFKGKEKSSFKYGPWFGTEPANSKSNTTPGTSYDLRNKISGMQMSLREAGEYVRDKIALAVFQMLEKEMRLINGTGEHGFPVAYREDWLKGTRHLCDYCMRSIANVYWICRMCCQELCTECFQDWTKPPTQLLHDPLRRHPHFFKRYSICSWKDSIEHTPQDCLLVHKIPKKETECVLREAEQWLDARGVAKCVPADVERAFFIPPVQGESVDQVQEVSVDQVQSEPVSQTLDTVPEHDIVMEEVETTQELQNTVEEEATTIEESKTEVQTLVPQEEKYPTPPPPIVSFSFTRSPTPAPPSHNVTFTTLPFPIFTHNSAPTLSEFQQLWQTFQPLIISHLDAHFQQDWSPHYFMEHHADEEIEAIDCVTLQTLREMKLRTFFQGYEVPSKRCCECCPNWGGDKGVDVAPAVADPETGTGTESETATKTATEAAPNDSDKSGQNLVEPNPELSSQSDQTGLQDALCPNSVSCQGLYRRIKIKDWPGTTDFKQRLPEHFDDFMNILPYKEYTTRNGPLNLASSFPRDWLQPDLGPKMYSAYESHDGVDGIGTTCLHLDMADACNVMMYTAENVWHADHVLNTDIPPEELERDPRPIGAVWDIYPKKDLPLIRRFLDDIAKELERESEDPVHDQNFYLNAPLRQRLFESYGVRGYRLYQRVGDAIFVPAGCAHQVCNYRPCIKVALDFVSPESIFKCRELTAEFRLLSRRHQRRCDLLQLDVIAYHAWRRFSHLEAS